MPSGVSELLTGASVRIDIGGQPNGSGFFISPAYVVTCAHVLDPYLATSASARAKLSIVDTQGGKHDVLDAPRVSLTEDLALLQLAAADTTVAVVLLDDGFEVNDPLQSFGFPEKKPGGDPTTFYVEGQTGGDVPHIKFKQGQVLPGTSGSALLNLRTGAVCGIVRRTRNDKTDLGGYGIRASSLFSTFEDVPRLNAEANAADRRWLDSLTVDQRRRVNVVRASLAKVEYTEFIIQVSQQNDQWLVTADEYPGGNVARVVVDLNNVRSEVPRLFRAWKAQGRIDDAEQSRLLGHVLYRSIVPDVIGSELEQLAFTQKRAVHVGLCFADGMDADLVHLPWEQLFVREPIKAPLGETPRATLTRVCEPDPDPNPSPAPPQAEMLIVSAPSAGHREIATMTSDLVKGVSQLTRIVHAPGGGSAELTLDEVEARIKGDEFSILHYVGYGRYQSNRDEIAMTDNASIDPEFVDADQLGQALITRPPRLVVMQTCGTDPAMVPVDPTTFAMTLIGSGVQAVVAFPYPLAADIALKASNRLYERLDAGVPMREAIQDTRRLLRASPWSRPALFLCRPSDLALVSAR
jgi:Trypsin-like peptidase domain/CHAT domain